MSGREGCVGDRRVRERATPRALCVAVRTDDKDPATVGLSLLRMFNRSPPISLPFHSPRSYRMRAARPTWSAMSSASRPPLIPHSPCFPEPIERKLTSACVAFCDVDLCEFFFCVHASCGVNFGFLRYRPTCFLWIASAFIVNVRDKLEPDFSEVSYKLPKIVVDVSLGNIPTDADVTLPQRSAPTLRPRYPLLKLDRFPTGFKVIPSPRLRFFQPPLR